MDNKDQYRKLDNQPLQFAIAEFKFSKVLDIKEYIPKLQNELRKQYPSTPLIKSEQSIQIQNGAVTVTTSDRWSFLTVDKKAAVEISEERLIYYTADYPRFGGFSKECERILNLVATIVEPGLILRIGLRYGDLIAVDKSNDISYFVDPHFGYPECVSKLGSPVLQRNETLIKTQFGNLMVRSFYGVHGLSCLPDIQNLPVAIDKIDTPSEKMILDFDHFWESPEQNTLFNVRSMLQTLKDLHETSRHAFWKITTKNARDNEWS